MSVNKEIQRDRAAEHTESYNREREEFLKKAGPIKEGRLKTTAEEVEAAMTYWERRGHGIAYVATAQQGFPLHNLYSFIGEMAPNSQSEIHRHMNEAVIHILDGAGHTIFDVDGERLEWKKGDTICIPQWWWHQHFNPNDQPVRYLATINRPLIEALGMWKIEDYEGQK